MEKEPVKLVQYMRPSGRKVKTFANVESKYAYWVKKDNLELSCEVSRTGEVAIYVRRADEPEENEIVEMARNSPGPNSPIEVLQKLIMKKHFEKIDKGD